MRHKLNSKTDKVAVPEKRIEETSSELFKMVYYLDFTMGGRYM